MHSEVISSSVGLVPTKRASKNRCMLTTSRLNGQPAARRRRATEPPRNRGTRPRRRCRLPATSSASEGSARCLTFLHLKQAYNHSAACHLSGSVTNRLVKIDGSHARLTRNSELIVPLVFRGFSLYFLRESAADTARNLFVYGPWVGGTVLSEGNAICRLPRVLR